MIGQTYNLKYIQSCLFLMKLHHQFHYTTKENEGLVQGDKAGMLSRTASIACKPLRHRYIYQNRGGWKIRQILENVRTQNRLCCEVYLIWLAHVILGIMCMKAPF
jgi:hypothetical protein